MPKQPDNKNQSTRHHNRRSPEPGQNHALTLNGRIMVLLLVIGFIAAGCGVLIYKLYTLQIRATRIMWRKPVRKSANC